MNKPLSRRLFGKAMAAVPLAVSEAPKLAASAKMANTGGLAGQWADLTSVQDPYPSNKPIGDAEWREHRRKELQAIIDGKDENYERDTLSGNPFVAHHYDSLRSISSCARAVLFHRENARRAKLERISWARRELQNLVRKFF